MKLTLIKKIELKNIKYSSIFRDTTYIYLVNKLSNIVEKYTQDLEPLERFDFKYNYLDICFSNTNNLFYGLKFDEIVSKVVIETIDSTFKIVATNQLNLNVKPTEITFSENDKGLCLKTSNTVLLINLQTFKVIKTLSLDILKNTDYINNIASFESWLIESNTISPTKSYHENNTRLIDLTSYNNLFYILERVNKYSNTLTILSVFKLTDSTVKEEEIKVIKYEHTKEEERNEAKDEATKQTNSLLNLYIEKANTDSVVSVSKNTTDNIRHNDINFDYSELDLSEFSLAEGFDINKQNDFEFDKKNNSNDIFVNDNSNDIFYDDFAINIEDYKSYYDYSHKEHNCNHNNDCKPHDNHHNNDCNPHDNHHKIDCHQSCNDNKHCDDFNKDCHTDCQNHYKKHDHCESSCNEILHSIAKVELSIAHILNSEGEKIQKIISCSDNVCDILEVNSSVTEVIEKVTKLEESLCCKLKALKDVCPKKHCEKKEK